MSETQIPTNADEANETATTTKRIRSDNLYSVAKGGLVRVPFQVEINAAKAKVFKDSGYYNGTLVGQLLSEQLDKVFVNGKGESTLERLLVRPVIRTCKENAPILAAQRKLALLEARALKVEKDHKVAVREYEAMLAEEGADATKDA